MCVIPIWGVDSVLRLGSHPSGHVLCRAAGAGFKTALPACEAAQGLIADRCVV